MNEIDVSADELVGSLLSEPADRGGCILDSCGVGHQNSHLLIAGIDPVATISVQSDPIAALQALDEVVEGDRAAIFTLSYDLGRMVQRVGTGHEPTLEPLVFISLFDDLIVHDYRSGKTRATGNVPSPANRSVDQRSGSNLCEVTSNFSRSEYIQAIATIKEEIRNGNTYQTNLTREISTTIGTGDSPASIFSRLRRRHPAQFSAFVQRPHSTVVSASPERFFRIDGGVISASPIKGTRPRGITPTDDERLRQELLNSRKDRAENTMIVDLLRNDLGRVCEFGSVEVESLCEIEELPSLFHLVSTIKGRLRSSVTFSDILRALFPCGSITGAPKISTMKIIDTIERSARGLSMGAIGCYIPSKFEMGESVDLSVAIRTMVIREGVASFNVGGGIVIDSDPEKEWDETVVKSKALLNSLGIDV